MISVHGRLWPLKLQRSARARRIGLRLCPVTRSVRLTLPLRAREKDGLAFVQAQQDWLAKQLAGWDDAPGGLLPGSVIPFGDGTLTLYPGGGRLTWREGERLLVGGSADAFAARALRWLKAEALRVLEAETRGLAATMGGTVSAVGVGDAARRWGSCSTKGNIRYSWRLILMPGWVRRSIVAHEVAHLRHPNHGADFWALAEELSARLSAGRPVEARKWLRAHGMAIHSIGR
ncbi:M48 family metallopeptidase [Sandaracinobacteroides saxicola]|uniref:M48 family metallopeptidase n=1 Tax=Sandaracinobacteroides saxicola TaxID=2759707 RepID=A0A7G5IMV7_9SPHN|nr:SprT family zinc-dependent metalloprotease [Sandaracinobacteroides saxicola]QMW24699.1 M48 family metallopeptidase [Sandaracinobacteroides saxicola]